MLKIQNVEKHGFVIFEKMREMNDGFYKLKTVYG